MQNIMHSLTYGDNCKGSLKILLENIVWLYKAAVILLHPSVLFLLIIEKHKMERGMTSAKCLVGIVRRDCSFRTACPFPTHSAGPSIWATCWYMMSCRAVDESRRRLCKKAKRSYPSRLPVQRKVLAGRQRATCALQRDADGISDIS
jgi:hypothetical protein